MRDELNEPGPKSPSSFSISAPRSECVVIVEMNKSFTRLIWQHLELVDEGGA
jgi:hypothetical protein